MSACKPASYYEDARSEMVPFVPPEARAILDVGCGGGAFGALLKSAESTREVWGVEPVEAIAQTARLRIDRVLVGTFTNPIDLPREYFDEVVFNDSLEHFPEPYSPLELCKSVLKPNGVVVASVPNVRYIENVKHFLIEQDWRYTNDGILDTTHLRFFTKKSLVRTFEEAGYEVLRLRGINRRTWTGWKMALIERLLRGRVEDMMFLQFALVARPRDGPES